MNKANVYAGVALVAALLIGGTGGYALGRRSFMKRSAPGMRAGEGMTLLGVSRNTLLDSLGLTPGQRGAVDSLLEAGRVRADSSVDRLMTDVRAVTMETRLLVRAALEERQRTRFDSLLSAAPEIRMRTPVPPRPR
jgi:hypothetical protein